MSLSAPSLRILLWLIYREFGPLGSLVPICSSSYYTNVVIFHVCCTMQLQTEFVLEKKTAIARSQHYKSYMQMNEFPIPSDQMAHRTTMSAHEMIGRSSKEQKEERRKERKDRRP